MEKLGLDLFSYESFILFLLLITHTTQIKFGLTYGIGGGGGAGGLGGQAFCPQGVGLLIHSLNKVHTLMKENRYVGHGQFKQFHLSPN